jgi:tetratricopeptide (TPR) repeat protein
MLAFMMALTLSMARPAQASGWACEDCCREAGLAGCPTRARVYGDGSLAIKEGASWRIKGLWWINCDAPPTFDPGATAVISDPPRAGQIIRLASPPATVRCFQQVCADSLPHNACIIEHDEALFRLVRCDDQQPLSQPEMLRPALIVQPPPAPTVAVMSLQPLGDGLVAPIELPQAPDGPCRTSEVVAAEAERRLARGDAARLAGALDEAVGEYLAAIAMDRCSVGGWSALGAAALGGGRLSEARAALRVAVSLDEGHYGALTALGEVEERMGQRTAAAAAYRAALSVRPSHEPAARGLARTGSE